MDTFFFLNSATDLVSKCTLVYPVNNIYDNKIDLSVDDEDLIGSSFFLQIIIAGTVYSEIVINIIE